MHEQAAQEAARARVAAAYHKLQKNLRELVAALNILEPGGTLLEPVTIADKHEGRVQITYSTVPLQVTVSSVSRKFILKMIDGETVKMGKEASA